MGLVHYTATTVTSGGTSQTIISGDGSSSKTVYLEDLFTVPSGGEMLVMGIRINGGENGGELGIVNSQIGLVNIKSNSCFSVAANDMIYLDVKECYTAGESVGIYSDQPGITVDVFGYISTVNS